MTAGRSSKTTLKNAVAWGLATIKATNRTNENSATAAMVKSTRFLTDSFYRVARAGERGEAVGD